MTAKYELVAAPDSLVEDILMAVATHQQDIGYIIIVF